MCSKAFPHLAHVLDGSAEPALLPQHRLAGQPLQLHGQVQRLRRVQAGEHARRTKEGPTSGEAGAAGGVRELCGRLLAVVQPHAYLRRLEPSEEAFAEELPLPAPLPVPPSLGRHHLGCRQQQQRVQEHCPHGGQLTIVCKGVFFLVLPPWKEGANFQYRFASLW